MSDNMQILTIQARVLMGLYAFDGGFFRKFSCQ